MTTASPHGRLIVGFLAAFTALTASACSSATAPGDSSTNATPAKPIKGVEFDRKIADMMPKSIKGSKVLKMVVFQNTPYTIIDDKGNIQGLSTDLAAAVGTVLGVKVQQTQVAGVADAKVAVQSGRYDIGFGPFLPSAESLKTMNIVETLATSKSLLYKKGGTKVDGLTDFCGKTLTIASGSVPAQTAIDNFNHKVCPEAGLKPVVAKGMPEQSSQIVAVQSGRAFGANITDSAAAYYAQSHPDFSYYVLKDGDPQLFPPSVCGNIILKRNDELTKTWAAVMAKLYDSGASERLFKKWGAAPELIKPKVMTEAPSVG
ncbi:transporter substrate-binding domain-containing protein [Streptomyces sp. SID8361]|uniref:transporter substrate-binding domain-containing protein n=1 Tax=Streptomyces sp. MnatMP-M27 TaxID=1839768 RepID=UPI00081E5388|nr:transporter substrate-binding domain-containing protein [Streptomyces sp. MnatMP-M27]MYU11171.1 transporter substrate-binding domain-containing protein [Streptomyces sp. SID8361]SCF78893.1 ABC-type amino acid transport substrate-binding protein [Streptomyces sp. MnatMP-M27]